VPSVSHFYARIFCMSSAPDMQIDAPRIFSPEQQQMQI